MDNSSDPNSKEHRADPELRKIFVEVYDLVSEHLTDQGQWISMIHEVMAHDAIGARFPEITEVRLFAILNTVAGAKASGRRPAN